MLVCLLLYPYYFFLYFLFLLKGDLKKRFVYLNSRMTGRRHKEGEIFHSQVHHHSKVCKSQGWSSPKIGAKDSIQEFLVGSRVMSTWAMSTDFPGQSKQDVSDGLIHFMLVPMSKLFSLLQFYNVF